MLVSTVRRPDLGDRFDPAFYAPQVLEVEAWFDELGEERCESLSALVAPVASAFYEAIAHWYTRDGVPLVRVNDVRNGGLRLQDATYLPHHLAHETSGLQTVAHPVLLISKGGVPASVGRVALSSEARDYALSRDVIGLLPRHGPDYLSFLLFYLASVPGRAQVMRGASRQCQAHLTLDRLAQVLVPVIDDDALGTLVASAEAVLSAQQEFDIARGELDAALEEFDPFTQIAEPTLTFLHPQDSRLRIRMDPGYYRPGIRAVREEARREDWVPLAESDWIEFVDDVWERGGSNPSGEQRYVALASVEAYSGRVTKSRMLPTWRLPSRAKWVIREHDVLFPYLLGSLKRVGVAGPDDEGAIASSGFHLLRTASAEDGLALAAFLSGRGAQAQIASAGTGAVMQSVTADLLGTILLPPRQRLEGVDRLLQATQKAAATAEEAWSHGMANLYEAIGWHGSDDTAWLDDPESGQADA